MKNLNVFKICLLLFVLSASGASLNAKSKAKFGYMLFESETSWVAEDSIARVGANIGEGGGFQNFRPVGCVSIFNKTEDVIYVDLTQCFISKNGISQSLYDNNQYVRTNGSSSNASLNLGAITNAAGIGGAVGSIANGINVGGGSNASSSTIYQAERIVTVAPLSTYTITVPLINNDFDLPNFKIRKTTGWNKNRIDGATLVLTDLFAGESTIFTRETSPICISFFVKYADNPNFSEPKKQRLSFWANELFGTKKAWWDGDKAKKELIKYGKGDVNWFVHCMTFYVDKNW